MTSDAKLMQRNIERINKRDPRALRVSTEHYLFLAAEIDRLKLLAANAASPVREDYDPAAVAAAADHILPHSIRQAGAIAERMTAPPASGDDLPQRLLDAKQSMAQDGGQRRAYVDCNLLEEAYREIVHLRSTASPASGGECERLRRALVHIENHELRDHEDYEAIKEIASEALSASPAPAVTEEEKNLENRDERP